MKKNEVNRIILILAIEFKNATPRPDTAEFDTKVKYWFDALKDYDGKIVNHVFDIVMKQCKFCPTLADIVEQIETIQNLNEPTEEKLWSEFVDAAKKVEDLSCQFKYSGLLFDNGPSQGEAARAKAENVFDDLPYEVKEFCNNLSGLINYGKIPRDELTQYTKPIFMRRIPQLRERAKIRRETPSEFLQLSDKLSEQKAIGQIQKKIE